GLDARRHPRELDHGNVGGGLGGDHVRGDRLAAGELHGDLVHGVHDVGGGDHFPVGGDEDARADLAEVDETPGARDLSPLRPDHGHRGAHLPVHLLHALRLDAAGDAAEDGRDEEPRERYDEHGYMARMTRPAPDTESGSGSFPSRMTGRPFTNDHWTPLE